MARSAASMSTDVSLTTGTHCCSLGAQHCTQGQQGSRHTAHSQYRPKYTKGNMVDISTHSFNILVLLYPCPVDFHKNKTLSF